MADNCPISTRGLQALVDLLEKQDGSGQVRKLKEEQALISQRLEAAFGKPVSIDDVEFLKMRVEA